MLIKVFFQPASSIYANVVFASSTVLVVKRVLELRSKLTLRLLVARGNLIKTVNRVPSTSTGAAKCSED